MDWLKSFKNRSHGLENLSSKVIKDSLKFTEKLKSQIAEKHQEGTKEFSELYLKVFLEFIYFYINVIDRIAFSELGAERRNIVCDALVEVMFNNIATTFFQNGSPDFKAKLVNDFYNYLSDAASEYGKCTTWVLKSPEAWKEKFENNNKSIGTINLLIFNIMDILGYNIALDLQIMEMIGKDFDSAEIKKLVNEA